MPEDSSPATVAQDLRAIDGADLSPAMQEILDGIDLQRVEAAIEYEAMILAGPLHS